MTIPEALKELYVALGGSADDVANMSTNPELIAKIATIAGSGLPAVSATDNGDVLTVVDGAWGKAEPSGGDFVVISGTTSGGPGNTFTLTLTGKKISDINALIDAGKIVVISTETQNYYLSRVSESIAWFGSTYVNNNNQSLQYTGVEMNRTITTGNTLNGCYGNYTPSA